MKIINKIALTDLTNFGSKARKDIRPNVLIGEKKAFKKGDILDANAIEQLVDVMVRNGGSTEELEGVLKEIQDDIVSLEEKIDNIIGSAGTGFSSRLTDIEEQLADMDYHTIDELLQQASDDLRSVITKMQTCCGNVQLTVNELKALVTSRDQEIQQLVSDLDQKLTQYLEMVIDGQVIILGPSEIIQGDSFTYFTVGITSRGLEVLDNYDGVFSIVSEVPTYNAGTEDAPDIRPAVTISDHGVLNTVDIDAPSFTVSVKIEYDFGEQGVASNISNVLVKNLGAPSAEDMQIVGHTDDPQFAEKPYQLSIMGNTFTLQYIGDDSESINWDNIYFTWRVTGNVTGTYIDGNQEEQHYIEVTEYASDHIIIRNLVGQGSFKSGEIIVECYTRNSDRFLFDVHYGIELYDPEVLMSINSNYEVFTILAASGLIPEHNGQRDYITYYEATRVTMYSLAGKFNRYNNANIIKIKHFDEFQYFGINTNSSNTYYDRLPDGMFRNQSELESVTIPPNIRYIGGYMSGSGNVFDGCVNLKEITLPYNETITYPYNGQTQSKTFTTGVTSIYSRTFKDCTSLYKIYGGEGVSLIYADAFDGCIQFYDHWNEVDPETGEYVVFFEPQRFVMKSAVNDSSTTKLQFVDDNNHKMRINQKTTNVFAYRNNYSGRDDYNAITNEGGMLFSTGQSYIPLHADTRPANGVDVPLQPSFAIDRINPVTGEPETVFIRRDIFGIFYEALTTKPKIKYTYYSYDDAYEEDDTIVTGDEYKHEQELNIDDLDYHIMRDSLYYSNYKMVVTYVDQVQDNMIKFSSTQSTVEFINPPQGYTTRVVRCSMAQTWSENSRVDAGSSNEKDNKSSNSYNYTLAYYKDTDVFVRTVDGDYYTSGIIYINRRDINDIQNKITHIVVVQGDDVVAIPVDHQQNQSTTFLTHLTDIANNQFSITKNGEQMQVIDIVLTTDDNGSNYTSTYIWDYTNPSQLGMLGYKNTQIAISNDQGVEFPWATSINGIISTFNRDYYLPSFGEYIILNQASGAIEDLSNTANFLSSKYTFMSTMFRYADNVYAINDQRNNSRFSLSSPSAMYGGNTTTNYIYLPLEKINDSAAYIKSNAVIATEESKYFKYGGSFYMDHTGGYLLAMLIPDIYSIPTHAKEHFYSVTYSWDSTERLLPIISINSSRKVSFFGKENGNNYDVLCVSYPSGDIKYASVSKSNFDTSTNKLTAFGISAAIGPQGNYGASNVGIDCDTKTLQEMQKSIESKTWYTLEPCAAFQYGRRHSQILYAASADYINNNYG